MAVGWLGSAFRRFPGTGMNMLKVEGTWLCPRTRGRGLPRTQYPRSTSLRQDRDRAQFRGCVMSAISYRAAGPLPVVSLE